MVPQRCFFPLAVGLLVVASLCVAILGDSFFVGTPEGDAGAALRGAAAAAATATYRALFAIAPEPTMAAMDAESSRIAGTRTAIHSGPAHAEYAGTGSPACRRSSSVEGTSELLQGGMRNITVVDPLLGEVRRQFYISIPDASMAAGESLKPMPLVLGFHGQGGDPEGWSTRTLMTGMAMDNGFVAVFPAGINETTEDSTDISWNTGAAGLTSICLPNTTGVQCMRSCQRLGKCGRCNWATCYDDVHFIKTLLHHLESELCLDPARYFVFGESNGGMLTHHLVQMMPGVFLGAVPIFGSPLLGDLAGPQYQLMRHREKAQRTSILQLHGNADVTIPPHGGASEDGWFYETLERSLAAWAAVHDCSPFPTHLNTSLEGGPKNVMCHEFADCHNGSHVRYCYYDGHHGDMPDDFRAKLLIWRFITSLAVKPML